MERARSHFDEPRIDSTARLKDCRLGRHVSIGERVMLRDVTVGDFSYFERGGEAIYADIGKFCSIAANCRINALEHPMERLTTHKVSYRPNEYFVHARLDGEFRERRRQKRVSIAHDVWIGHGAVIMAGIRVGNGAVVGANAVVTRDVEAYAIVAGAPARMLRRRFPEAVSARIEALEWWDWPHDRIAAAVPDMQALEIEEFLDRWG